MKILHVATRANKGGTSKALRGSIEFEREAGHTSILITGGSTHDFADHTLPFLRRSINPLYDFLSVIALIRLIREIKPDVIHTHESKAGLLVRLISSSKTYILVHTVHMATFKVHRNNFMEICILNIEKFLAKKTHILIFVGQDLKSLYRSRGIKARDSEFVLYSRIPLENFHQAGLKKVEARDTVLKNLNINPDTKIILVAGLLEKRKRPDLTIKSLKSQLKKNNFHLVFCGVGKEQLKLEKLARKFKVQDKVHLIGFREDLPTWLAGADLLLHTSASEGVPQVLVQASAARTRVVATCFHGCSELSEVEWAEATGADLAKRVLGALSNDQSSFLQDFSFWDKAHIDLIHHDFLASCDRLIN